MIGHAFADIELSNPRNPALTPIASRALADTGALVLCIPDHVAIQLELEMESIREVTVAFGRSMRVPYVDPGSPNIPHARVKQLAGVD